MAATAADSPPASLLPESHDVGPATGSVEKLPTALTPPTSEELNLKTSLDQEESELSDLDLTLDSEDEEEIFPDHYWDEENGGKIPVFKPTMDQFRSFKKFIEKVDKYGMRSGIVKVIPPKEWRDSLPPLDEYVKRIRIKNPITQEFNGTFGTYTQQNVEKQRSYTLPEWKTLTEETQYQPPAKRGERRRHQEKVSRSAPRARQAPNPVRDDTTKTRKKPGRKPRYRGPAGEDASEIEPRASERDEEPPTPSSPPEKPAKKPRGRQPKTGGKATVTSRRLNNTAESADVIDEKAFENFDYHMEGLAEFTPERCAELESHYWRSLGFNQPMYAADMPGSLFDDKTTSWNVAKLENLLDVLGTKVPGVNTAYLYMGMWKATFAWHLEDVDLYSINYIHFGAPKQWYSISQEDARKFERAMKTVWPGDAKVCDQFLRHKTYLISPDVLQKQYGVKVNKLVHYEGEFVITYPYGYHSGYNLGYNCAESVNFATESWLEYGRIARKCNCEADNVWVDVSEIERKLRGEPTPEYYEETDDEDDEHEDDEDGNLPSPPSSVKGQKIASRKRKRESKAGPPKQKKRIRIKIRAPTREPCAMCPNDNPWEPLLPTDNGKKAHRSCALYTPETYVVHENGKEKICGVANIDHARLELKCNFCRSKRGACFQCSSKKCTRAFHATCAIAAGVLVDSGPVPTFGADGTEYFEEGFDFRCRYHRPKMPKHPNIDAMESSKRVNNYARQLQRNDCVQAQYIGGEVFGGLVIENRPNELSVVIDVIPDGERVEVEWKWLCVLDPSDSLRPKPSANALPMPEDMSKSNFSLANRQDGVPTQDECFHTDPAYKWQDFHSPSIPPPGYQVAAPQISSRLSVQMNTPDQLYFYLGHLSTDAKSFFTDTPNGKEAVSKANFLDRVSTKTSQPQMQIARRPPSMPPDGYPFARVQQVSQTIAPAIKTEKPYVYKPKEHAQPNPLCAVDYEALANQRSFIAEGGRSVVHQAPMLQQNLDTLQTSSGPFSASGPLRSFPPDQYYSSKTLPAAYQGEYSAFRRQSQGAQTMQRPAPELVGITGDPTAHTTSHKSSGPLIGGNPFTSTSTSRPSSSAHSHYSPSVVPLTPATTLSNISKSDGSVVDLSYIQNLQKYPYLMNSFCRRPKSYQSPYASDGGFTSKYQPLELYQIELNSETRPMTGRSSSNSLSSVNDAVRRSSQQWTPPSQLWDRAGFSKTLNDSACRPPTQHSHQALNYSLLPHQGPSPPAPREDLPIPQLPGLPSTASRDGAQARLLRDQGIYPLPQHSPTHYLKPQNANPVFDAKMWLDTSPTPPPQQPATTSTSTTPVPHSHPQSLLHAPHLHQQPPRATDFLDPALAAPSSASLGLSRSASPNLPSPWQNPLQPGVQAQTLPQMPNFNMNDMWRIT